MVTVHPKDIHRQASTLLQQRTAPNKLVLLHTAIALGCSVLLTAVYYLVSLGISNTGGLSGLGLRAMLETLQAVLELAVRVALPFWEIGLLFAALQWTSGKDADFSSLLQGFRRMGSVLACRLLTGGIFLALGISLFYICATVYVLTPFSAPLLELLAPITNTAPTPEQVQSLLTPELMTQMTQAMIPFFILFGILFLLVSIPLFYRLRFGEFGVMDGMPGSKAVLKSLHITRRNSLTLLKLDLHFWWFYLLQLMCLAISCADPLLPMLGIHLPLSASGSFFLFYGLGAALQCLLFWRFRATVLSAYCLAYRAFAQATLPTPADPEAQTAQ